MKRPVKFFILNCAVVLLILTAFLLRMAGKLEILVGDGYGITRSAIYILLFAGWGVSVRFRIIQKQVRHYLLAISSLMTFWLAVRTAKYFFVTQPDAKRMLWYMFYIPILLIPLLMVFISLSLGKDENDRLPKRTALLFIPTLFFILLVLTNDLHCHVFTFPADAAVWSDDAYSYAFGYGLVATWAILCAIAALVFMIIKTRVPQTKKVLLLPFIPIAMAIIYTALYVMNVPALNLVAGDLTVTVCIFFIAFFECCISSGLIQSNTHYGELFRISEIAAQITDKDYNIIHTSEAARSVPIETMRKTKSGAVALDENTRLSAAPIHDGYVLWTEDISEVNALLRELKTVGRELEGQNALMVAENELKEKKVRVDAQNHLYDRITRETAPQLDAIDELLISASENDADIRDILGKTCVLGAYIKRYGNLVILSESSNNIPADELFYCLRESADNLEAAGVVCSCVSATDGIINVKTACMLYSFFEAVTELSLPSLKSMLIRFTVNSEKTTLRLLLSCETEPDTIKTLREYALLTESGAECILSGGNGEISVDISKGGDAK